MGRYSNLCQFWCMSAWTLFKTVLNECAMPFLKKFRQHYCGLGGRAFAVATRCPQEIRSDVQSSRLIEHSMSVGPSRFSSAILIASASSLPLVTGSHEFC